MSIRPLYEFDEETRNLIVRAHLEMPRGGTVTGPTEGAFGEVYSIVVDRNHRIAAKCPQIRKFGTQEQARTACEKLLHELEKTHQLFKCPWINRYFDVQIIQGWPFILSRYRDGSLNDLIANPLAWTSADRISSLILITRALRFAVSRGVSSHQDLKPGNIFFDDLNRSMGIPKDSLGMHFHMFVGDFGNADAFREFGRNSGSRPYMAPEQFASRAINPTGVPSFDVFSLAVIACECFLDGTHPCGVVTRDYWPWREGILAKWKHEDVWKKWSRVRDKTLPKSADRFPPGIPDLLRASLSVDPASRPSLAVFEDGLWIALQAVDAKTADGLRMQVDWVESLAGPDNAWPHMDGRLQDLREFYSSV